MARISPHSHTAWEKEIRYGDAHTVLDLRSENDEDLVFTVSICPVRAPNATAAGAARESAGRAIFQFGSARQGRHQEFTADIGRGHVWTIPATWLRVDIRNIGGGQQENIPAARFRAMANVGSTARPIPPKTVVPIPELVAGGPPAPVTPTAFIPDFAYSFEVPRFPPVALRVRFFGGAGQALSEYYIPRDEMPRNNVPKGAERTNVELADGESLQWGQIEYELAGW